MQTPTMISTRIAARATVVALGAILLAAIEACSGGAPEDAVTEETALQTSTFTNPIIRMYDRPAGVSASDPSGVPHDATEGCPDPMALRTQGGEYFVYCTSYTFPFSRLNGFPVFKSATRSLAGPWEPVGSIIPDRNGTREAWPKWIRDTNGARDGSFWGVDVHQLRSGKFAASYSAPCGDSRWGDRRCVGIAWANGPDGPWTHAESAFVTPENNGAGGGDSYDPNLLITSQNELYFYWVVPGAGVYVRRVSADGNGALDWYDATGPKLIADHRKGQAGEGPYVVEHDGAFYEFYSTGSLYFSYHVGVRRGARPDQLFEVEGPEMVVQRNSHFVATGGNSVVDDGAGGSFLAYHAILVPSGGGCPRENPVWGGAVVKNADNPHCRVEGERQAMIDPMEWKRFADGFDWPVLKNGHGTPSVGKTSLR